MLFSQASLLLAISTVVAAVPLEKKWFGFGGSSWSTPSSASSALSDVFDFGKRHSWEGRDTQNGLCDLSSAELPSSSLPAPSSGLTLFHVAVGRGTQNYTCDTTDATAVPVSVGAVASLFNVTCMSSDYPKLLSAIPGIAVNIPLPSALNDPSSPAYQDLSGHHYFTDTTTPYFNLDTALVDYGQGAFKKNASANAPADAPANSVAWLKLTTKNASQCRFQEVYRVNTAGGNPPATCAGQPAVLTVQYSAEYWFFGN